MFKRLNSRLERNKKNVEELELKRSLKEKLALYERRHLVRDIEDSNCTEITVKGNRVRVQKNHITEHDIATNTFFIKPTWRMIS